MFPEDRPEDQVDREHLSDWVVRASPDGLWVLDAEGVTTFGNERMAEMLGVEKDAIVGFSAYDALDDADRARFREHLTTLQHVREPGEDLELCLRSQDGTSVRAVVSHVPLLDDAGVFRGWLHRASEHMVERRLLEEFERREEQFADAQRLAQIGSWDRDLVGGGRTWSDELFRVYGLDKSTLTPSYEAFLARVHSDDRERVDSNMTEALAGEAPFDIEFRFVPDSGESKWIRCRAVVTHDASGKAVRMCGTSQDITVSKENENALAFLVAMGQVANEAHTLQDVLLAAEAIVRPLAQWPAVVVSVPTSPGSTDLEHLEVDWKPATDEQRQAARDLANAVAVERRTIEVLGPSGSVLIGGAVVAGGRLACVLVSDTLTPRSPNPAHRDLFSQMLTMLSYVAEREWGATELAAVRDQALSASKAKSEFLATMSHEIRTPLNGVIGLSGLLGSTELTPHQRRLTDGVGQAGRTLLALVNDILDLSKIEAGRLDLEEVDFDPRAVIEQSAALVAGQARKKHLELVVSSAGDVPDQVRGDPVRFGQVITNLAANAVKFTSAGEVVIRATGTPGPHGTQLRVEVSDTGIGVSPEVEGRLFEAFSQADSSTTRHYGGTGLGLTISKRIVSAMDGEIGVESEVGVGSTFWFTASLAPPLHDGPGRDEARENAVAGLRVLIVDDNETNRFILTEKLAAWQVGVRATASAYEALVELDAAVRSGAPYDIVLLDYMMPGTDGEQLARVIRTEARNDRTRLALLSSATDPTAEFLTAAGIDTFLAKPVMPSQLLDMLATLGGRLDADKDLPVATPVLAPDPTGSTARGRILVVEDNPVNQLVAVGVLERLGYSVMLADDGAAGLAAFTEDQQGFDAILMDCQMPVMDGYDATRAIRALASAGARTPVIAMTAGAEAEERQRCLDAGMDDFLLKPIDVALLEQALTRWIPGTALAASHDAPPGPVQHAPAPPTAGPRVPAPPAAAEASQDLVVLDRSRLSELLETGAADLALLFRILARFRGRADDAALDMAAAVRAEDTGEVSRLAHRLRGGAANVGLVRLARLCESLELNAAAGELPAASVLFEIEDEVTAGVVELESFTRDMVRDAAAATHSLESPGTWPSWV